MPVRRYTIGLDVGGTNTDCVVLRASEVIGSCKRPTSKNVTSGVHSSLDEALKDASRLTGESVSDIAAHVARVNIGTTHFVNAVVQRKSLARVATIRLCGPASISLPPFVDFPSDLADKIKHSLHLLDGGFRFDGKEIVPVNDKQVISCITRLQQGDYPCKNVVVAGLFSPLSGEQEEHVGKLIADHFPDVSVTKSYEVGQLGILERENAAILNESLKPLANTTVHAFREALDSLGLRCPFNLTQNDGTLISAERAMSFPVLVFTSGPTNSMRGAAFLSKVSDAIVIDIGGTTTDVGMICKGFPREASSQAKIGGVSTNFRMPDVLSIGLGGGSLVDVESGKVGPVSVGYRLCEEAQVFGGETLTATDIAVAKGMADIGSIRPAVSLTPNQVTAIVETIHKMVEDAVDRVKITKEDLPVLLVGGGSILIDSSMPFTGASSVDKPLHYDVANAVGAAISQVGGSADYVVSLEQKPRDVAISEAKERAKGQAIKEGAVAESVKIVEVTEIPLTYLPGNAVRLKVKAVGDLADAEFGGNLGLTEVNPSVVAPTSGPPNVEKRPFVQPTSDADEITTALPTETAISDAADSTTTSRMIDQVTGDWTLSAFDVECISVGAGILGCGGGGSPRTGKLRALQALKQGHSIQVINPNRLGTTSDLSGLVVPVAIMGAPTILLEKLTGGQELKSGVSVVQKLINAGLGGGMSTHPGPDGCGTPITNPSPGVYCPSSAADLNQSLANTADRQICAVVSCEVGGLNCIEPLIVGAELGLPVVDADGMGRAFPELQMYSPSIYGCQLGPCCLSDEMGECVAITHVDSAKQLEDFMRIHTLLGWYCDESIDGHRCTR
ncbi:uncharacterized protein LOC134179729 isoform X2 [Corticium candelabrum]|uniref:uncharacterized protein LOC134179729 isoform X2 n=1 Tax=Corticium candelabrum TaxID=121492 RepID=UPI002E25826D|nr:uncharacterized protein LOC134179729 isoform X2 [Corticium candelabrum]